MAAWVQLSLIRLSVDLESRFHPGRAPTTGSGRLWTLRPSVRTKRVLDGQTGAAVGQNRLQTELGRRSQNVAAAAVADFPCVA